MMNVLHISDLEGNWIIAHWINKRGSLYDIVKNKERRSNTITLRNRGGGSAKENLEIATSLTVSELSLQEICSHKPLAADSPKSTDQFNSDAAFLPVSYRLGENTSRERVPDDEQGGRSTCVLSLLMFRFGIAKPGRRNGSLRELCTSQLDGHCVAFDASFLRRFAVLCADFILPPRFRSVIVLERRSLFFTMSYRDPLLLIQWAIIQFPSKSDICRTFIMSEQSELTMNDSINNMLVVSSGSNLNPIESYDPEALRNSFHSEIRPILDVLDKLRTQGITEENVNIPTIVVVGDQSSGKSSVLESLAGITLPRGQGIATGVPLILRLQSCLSEQNSKILMEYGSVKEMRINSEDDIEAAINAATDDLAGSNKNIRNTPISLHIRKPDAPDLPMVDLPGITHVLVHGQLENIYEEVRDMIMRYIKPEESIILNVLPAEVDFSTCESIRLSQTVDKKGVRTLAVVTKVDKAPEGLFKKVTSDAVGIGLGYVCVRNRTPADDSIAVARCRELELFNDHPDLRNIDRSMVGIPTLARRLVKIQSDMKRRQEMSNVPRSIDSVNEAVAVFLRLQNEMLNMLTQVVRDGDFSLVPDDCTLHYTARLHEEFTKFAEDLGKSGLRLSQPSKTDEIRQMFSEHQGVALPDFLPHTVLHQLVKKQIDSITQTCIFLVDRVFKYAAEVVLHVQSLIFEVYPHLRDKHHKLAIQVLNETKMTTVEFVERMLAKERTVIFTTNAS
nr:hypothetical protein PHYPA_010448 [Physcomitrium patens]